VVLPIVSKGVKEGKDPDETKPGVTSWEDQRRKPIPSNPIPKSPNKSGRNAEIGIPRANPKIVVKESMLPSSEQKKEQAHRLPGGGQSPPHGASDVAREI
jgi:hypothetical protein